jgi:hypothetical protein
MSFLHYTWIDQAVLFIVHAQPSVLYSDCQVFLHVKACTNIWTVLIHNVAICFSNKSWIHDKIHLIYIQHFWTLSIPGVYSAKITSDCCKTRSYDVSFLKVTLRTPYLKTWHSGRAWLWSPSITPPCALDSNYRTQNMWLHLLYYMV